MRNARTAFVVLIYVIGCLGVFGQATTSLRGHVTDSSGAAISGANCELTLTATGATRQGKADTAGEYQFVQLPPGEYSLKVSSQGFSDDRKTRHELAGRSARNRRCHAACRDTSLRM